MRYFGNAGVGATQRKNEGMNEGCTVEGTLTVAPVGGMFQIGLSPNAWGSVLAYTGITEDFKKVSQSSETKHEEGRGAYEDKRSD